MNSAPPIPGLRSLYWQDRTIQRAAKVLIAGVVGAAGIVWATQPSKSPPPGVDLSFERAANRWAPVAGVVVSTLGAAVLVRRYLWVKKILSQGITIKGLVADLEVFSSTPSGNSNSSRKRTPRRAYYATLRYAVHGVEQEVCLRLPNSGFTYGLVKGQETDLVVLDYAPKKPLIRSVYLPPCHYRAI